MPTGMLILAFPEGGVFPFVFSAFWPALLAGAALAAFGPREWPALRIGGGLYALLALAAYVVDTPLGGNTARLGTLLAPPIAVLVLWPRHKAILGLREAAGRPTWTRHLEVTKTASNLIGRNLGTLLTPTETVVFDLLGRAGSDEFRALSRVIK